MSLSLYKHLCPDGPQPAAAVTNDNKLCLCSEMLKRVRVCECIIVIKANPPGPTVEILSVNEAGEPTSRGPLLKTLTSAERKVKGPRCTQFGIFTLSGLKLILGF